MLATAALALSLPFATPAGADDATAAAQLRIEGPSQVTPGQTFDVRMVLEATTPLDNAATTLTLVLPERLIPKSASAPGFGCSIRQLEGTPPSSFSPAQAICQADAFSGTSVTMTAKVSVGPGATAVDALRGHADVNADLVSAPSVDIHILGTTPAATVSGRIWNDLNRDGRQDSGEPGIPGIGVMNGPDRVETGADGRYTLPHVEFGEVTLEFVIPNTYAFSPQNVGDDAGDSDIRHAVNGGCGPDCVFGVVTFDMTGPTTIDGGLFDPTVTPPSSSPTTSPTSAGAAPTSTPSQSAPQPRSTLANTGTPVGMLVPLGGALVLAGAALLVYTRRRVTRGTV